MSDETKRAIIEAQYKYLGEIVQYGSDDLRKGAHLDQTQLDEFWKLLDSMGLEFDMTGIRIDHRTGKTRLSSPIFKRL